MDDTSSPDDRCAFGAAEDLKFEQQSEWDRFIRRSAINLARSTHDRAIEAEDIAQVARMRLFRLGPHARTARNWVGKVLYNEMRRAAGRTTPYDRLTSAADEVTDRRVEAEKTTVMRMAVRNWVDELGHDLRAVYELLYVFDLSQREAAAVLGFSQSRVSQLHRELLRAGRREFTPLAA